MAPKRKPTAPPGQVLPEFRRIPLDRIIEPELAARATMSDTKMRELIDSFRAVGQLEPITVEQHEAMFEVITGHRRYLAARELEWKELAAMVYPEGQAQRWAMMIHENECREDLNPAEEALFMAQMREKLSLDEEGLCKLFHRGPDYIAGRFALLRGDPQIFSALQQGQIRLGVAHELNRITADDMRAYYLDCARRSDPPARVVHQWVAQWMAQIRPTLPGTTEASAPGNGQPGAVAASVPGGGESDGAAGAETPAPTNRLECALCGGHKDPYNLIQVTMHHWHWSDIEKAVERAGKGE